jgi:peptidoglycan/LPS O-acetylase OafA/YrhL
MLVATMTVITASLHPARREFLRSFSLTRVNRIMLALVTVAAVPLIVLASTNVGLQATAGDDHAAMRHYGFMAAFGFGVVGVGLLASLRPDGWWIPAWVAGLLPSFLGLASLVYPAASSSLDVVWSLAAIAWGVVFVAAAELTQRPDNPTLLGSLGVPMPARWRIAR